MGLICQFFASDEKTTTIQEFTEVRSPLESSSLSVCRSDVWIFFLGICFCYIYIYMYINLKIKILQLIIFSHREIEVQSNMTATVRKTIFW
jgi:hypothetical protein